MERARPIPFLVVTLLATLVATSCAPDGSEGAAATELLDTDADGARAWFRETAVAAGIDFRHVRGPRGRYWFPEIMGAGVALFDADGDADLDLYCVQGGDLAQPGLERNRLFVNDGGGRFEDVSRESGADHGGYGMGCATGDADGDGDVDLFVTNVGPNALFSNTGEATFRDVTDSGGGLADDSWGTSAAFFDAENDGDLDLFVVNYVGWSSDQELDCLDAYGEREYCHPNNYNAPVHDLFLENQGDGSFQDATRRSGVAQAFGNGLGVVCADFDRDGRIDVYVANDGLANQLWHNEGGGRFRDRALLAGCALNAFGAPEAGMGVCATDPDGDGDADLFVTHLRGETNTFYENVGQPGAAVRFRDRTPQRGLAGPSVDFTGFGVGLADFDLDGWLDVLVANGRVGRQRPYLDPQNGYAEPDQLHRGGAGGFEELLPRGVVVGSPPTNSRGLALGDIDGDGDVDAVVVDNDAPLRLLENVARPKGAWCSVDARGANGLRDLGAWVGLRSGDRWRWRGQQSASSYCSASDPRAHFGLATGERADELVVRWGDGARERFAAPELGRAFVVRRGAGESLGR